MTPFLKEKSDCMFLDMLVLFQTKVTDIGLLFKVRVYFKDQHQGSSWFLSKVLIFYLLYWPLVGISETTAKFCQSKFVPMPHLGPLAERSTSQNW